MPVHAASDTYALDRLVNEPDRLSDVVVWDAPHLGDLTGLDVVHLQCHIGTDTVSLARLGGRVTGLDFSPGALAVGRDLAARMGLDVAFVEAELYAAPDVLGRRAVRPRVHGHRCAVLVARHHALGGNGRRPCCGRAAVSTSAKAIRCSGPPTRSRPAVSN